MTKTSVNMPKVQEIINNLKDLPGALLPILHGIKDELGYIPEETIPEIAKGLNLSRAEVHGVISFYHYFRSTPPGKHTIHICRAESCQAMGSVALESHVKQKLGIDYHETTADGAFSLEPVYCLGLCACSPSMQVGGEVYGKVTPDAFDELVEQTRINA
jgi:formate dehydrogenase subunit gamma